MKEEKKDYTTMIDSLSAAFGTGGEGADDPDDAAAAKAYLYKARFLFSAGGSRRKAFRSALLSLRAAERAAGEGRPVDLYEPHVLICRILYENEKYESILHRTKESELQIPEFFLWRELALYRLKRGGFPRLLCGAERAAAGQYSRDVLLEYAREALGSGRPRDARIAARGARDFPWNNEPDYIIALTYRQEGRNDRAAAVYRRLYEKEPENPVCFRNYIDSLLEAGMVESAMINAKRSQVKNDLLSCVYRFNLAALGNEAADRKKALRGMLACRDRESELIYYLKLTLHLRRSGRNTAARLSLREASARIVNKPNPNRAEHVLLLLYEFEKWAVSEDKNGDFPRASEIIHLPPCERVLATEELKKVRADCLPVTAPPAGREKRGCKEGGSLKYVRRRIGRRVLLKIAVVGFSAALVGWHIFMNLYYWFLSSSEGSVKLPHRW